MYKKILQVNCAHKRGNNGKIVYDNKGIWAKDYFVSTVGINEKIIKKYVKIQKKENTG